MVWVSFGVGVFVCHIYTHTTQAIFVSNCDERDTAEDVTMIFEKYGKVCGELVIGVTGVCKLCSWGVQVVQSY